MVTISQLKSRIKRHAKEYDTLAKSYNALVKKELSKGHLIISSKRAYAKNTAAGKAAAKRVVFAWNKVARKGKTLKAELEVFAKYQSISRKRKSSSSRKTATRKPSTRKPARRKMTKRR